MDENVAKAVARVDFCVDREKPVKWADWWQTIRARLVELEAENERLQQALADISGATVSGHPEHMIRYYVEQRADEAWDGKQRPDHSRPITAHLSENGHG